MGLAENETYSEINLRLRENSDLIFAKSRNRIISKNSSSYGAKVSVIREIVQDYLNSTNSFFEKGENTKIISKFLSSGVFDLQMAGVFLASSIKSADLLPVYKGWLELYVKDWAVCDTFSTEVLAPILEESVNAKDELMGMTRSPNNWVRRAALVSLIKTGPTFKNRKELLKEIIPLYKNEKDTFVRKAIVWANKTLEK